LEKKKSREQLIHLISGFSVGTIISCAFLSSQYLSTETTILLIVFNFFFVSLTFSLAGTLTRKLLLLLTGNAVGFFWNYLFYMLAYGAVYFFGESVNVLTLILAPILNLVWIVSFWSVSLTILLGSRDRIRRTAMV
jgi:hypothetical protein